MRGKASANDFQREAIILIWLMAFGFASQIMAGDSAWTITALNRKTTNLIYDPNNIGTMYATSEGWGVFLTLDSGSTWKGVNNGIAWAQSFCIVMDPFDSDTLYVGTNNPSEPKIYRTDNGGGLWYPASTGLTGNVFAMIIHPQNSSILYAGAEFYGEDAKSGVFKTTDGGTSWFQVNNGFTGKGVSFLAMDPLHPDTVYAGAKGYNTDWESYYGMGLFKTTDGGASWNPMNNGLPSEDLWLTTMLIDPVNPQILYMGDWDDSDFGYHNVYKSVNGGANWTAYSEGLPERVDVLCFVPHPQDSSIIFAGTAKDHAFVSADAGKSWAPIGGEDDPRQFNRLVAPPRNPLILFGSAQFAYGIWEYTVTCPQPTITVQPQSKNILPGQVSVLSVTVTGGTPLHYQWFQGASGVMTTPVGTDSSTFTTPALTTGASYWVKVSNTCGAAFSDTAVISVYSFLGNYTISGYLGVGLDTPERAVHIRGGNAVFRMDRNKDTAAFMIVRTDAANSVLKTFIMGVNASAANTGTFVISDLGGGTTGGGTSRLTIENDGNTIIGKQARATGFFTPSSRALKTDVRPLDGALETVLKLQGVRFNWRSTGAPSLGFIAEDAAAAIPEAGSWQAEGSNASGLDYARLAAFLVEGLKRQQQELDELRQQRDRMKSLLDDLQQLKRQSR